MLIRERVARALPYKVVHALKKVYMPLRNIINIPINLRGNYYRKRVSKHKCTNRKVRMVFLVYIPQSWNSLKTVYEAAKQHPDVEAMLVVTPNCTSDGRMEKHYDYFYEMDHTAIDAYQNGHWIDMKKLKPDIIFQQGPYDIACPKGFRSYETCRYSKICYVPYGYNPSPEKHLRIEYNDGFMANAYALFVDSKTAEDYVKNYIKKSRILKGIHVYNIGFPRFDLCRNRPKPKPHKFTYTWIPRWSLDDLGNDASGFFRYKDELISFFENHFEFDLIIRPHPLMFQNFRKLGVMTQAELDAFFAKIDDLPNVFMDQEKDYWMAFDKTDVLIADFSSLDVEFFLTGKPLIYCGDTAEFNKETKPMLQQFYLANNWAELKNHIIYLGNNEESNKAERELVIKDFLKGEQGKTGERIIRRCLKM